MSEQIARPGMGRPDWMRSNVRATERTWATKIPQPFAQAFAPGVPVNAAQSVHFVSTRQEPARDGWKLRQIPKQPSGTSGIFTPGALPARFVSRGRQTEQWRALQSIQSVETAPKDIAARPTRGMYEHAFAPLAQPVGQVSLPQPLFSGAHISHLPDQAATLARSVPRQARQVTFERQLPRPAYPRADLTVDVAHLADGSYGGPLQSDVPWDQAPVTINDY